MYSNLSVESLMIEAIKCTSQWTKLFGTLLITYIELKVYSSLNVLFTKIYLALSKMQLKPLDDVCC